MNLRFLLIVAAVVQACLGLHAARVDTISIATSHLESPEKVIVITPASEHPARAYPSAYLLNGYGGDHTSWLTIRPDLPQLADQYGMVLVMPDGRDSWYWDSPRDQLMQMETFITDDLVPYIDANYPTIADPSLRAITGLSMGGQGALYLAIRHSDIWKNAGSMSGGLDIRPFPSRWKMKERLGDITKYPDDWESHTPINLISTLSPGQLNITFDCGEDDFFAEVNENFHQELRRAGIPHDYTVRPGKHTMQYWNNSILYHLLFFDTAFKASDK